MSPPTTPRKRPPPPGRTWSSSSSQNASPPPSPGAVVLARLKRRPQRNMLVTVLCITLGLFLIGSLGTSDQGDLMLAGMKSAERWVPPSWRAGRRKASEGWIKPGGRVGKLESYKSQYPETRSPREQSDPANISDVCSPLLSLSLSQSAP
jgi:hypothetical protein